MVYPLASSPGGADSKPNGISRSNALGRILHFEALMRRRLGEVRPQRYVRLHNYYAGQNLPPDNTDQPLLINYFKTIIDKHVSFLWGQWKKSLFGWRVTPQDKEDMGEREAQQAAKYARKIKKYLDRIYEQNKGNQTFLAASKNGCLYGDSILEVRYDERQRRIVIESVLPEYFHAMWDISNMQNLTEVIIAYPIDRMVALEQYNTNGNDQFFGYQAINPDYAPGIGVLWKRWSTTSYQVWVDDTNVINEANPYMTTDYAGNVYPGIIPYVHVRNMPGGSEYFGYSDGETILYLSDELNRRMADMGDIVNNHAHPIITLTNMSGKQQDLPVGPDSIWDMGREGKAERLEGTGPQPEVLAYIQQVKSTMHETSGMPETAFGGSKSSGSHSSGLMMSMALMPAVERAKEKRIHWTEGLKDLGQMIFLILHLRDPQLLADAGLSYDQIQHFDIEPVWADVLPKDELQTVNEVVATYANGLRSLERALEQQGEEDIPAEIKRIKQDMLFKAAVENPTPPASGGTSGKNSDQGQGGSASLPGGIGASAGKPGTLIKSPELDKVDNVGIGNAP